MKKGLKKILAGVGAASLISAGGISLPGAASGSGWGANKSAGSAEVTKPAAASGWGASKDSTVSATVKEQEDKATATAEEAAKDAEEKVKKVLPKKESGKSGWS